MNGSSWCAARNERSIARLRSSLPAVFPPVAMGHALRQPLIPPTPRRVVESYWRAHPIRADRLARALASLSGTPDGWTWRLGGDTGSGLPASFRIPPAPYREAVRSKGPGHCCVCGQPVYRFGWHKDIWGEGAPNRKASWHACCVVAWKLWTAPSDFVRPLKVVQRHRCAQSGKRLLRSAEVDHRVPLYQIWRERRTDPWPDLLGFWGAPNLQVINRAAHVEKCAREAGDRAEAARAQG